MFVAYGVQEAFVDPATSKNIFVLYPGYQSVGSIEEQH